MKEIHAYLNDDGTYRLEIPTQVFDNTGELLSGKFTVSRAKLSIEPIVEVDTGKIYSLIVEENNNEIN